MRLVHRLLYYIRINISLSYTTVVDQNIRHIWRNHIHKPGYVDAGNWKFLLSDVNQYHIDEYWMIDGHCNRLTVFCVNSSDDPHW